MIAYPSSMVAEILSNPSNDQRPMHPSDCKQLAASTEFSLRLVGARSDERWTTKERHALNDAIAAIEVFSNE